MLAASRSGNKMSLSRHCCLLAASLQTVRVRPHSGNPVVLVDPLFPPGFLAGWSFLAALTLGLAMSRENTTS